MTNSQITVLHRFNASWAGAIYFDGKWIFPQDVRNNENLADRMAAHIKSGRGFEIKDKNRAA